MVPVISRSLFSTRIKFTRTTTPAATLTSLALAALRESKAASAATNLNLIDVKVARVFPDVVNGVYIEVPEKERGDGDGGPREAEAALHLHHHLRRGRS